MLAELRCIFDAHLRTSIYRHLPSRSPRTGQSFYMGPSSASDPVGGQALYMLSAMDSLHSEALQRAKEGALAIQSLRSENEDLCRQLLEARARPASPRTRPRIRRTVRKVTGHPPRLQHQSPQPVPPPAEPRSPVGDAEDVFRDIEIAP
ncbi:hypothetical protein GUJ93_ZPchr0010g7862 [Zizania palustris]|uniref:Uncharacterized protein n=1 Tax=Zizania palustris TaxID=103762 RepID=A0A8J5W7X5_ZIZPA|nr:hypothetical protein GUJ93_ZPchr0010g7862 [Zizania palustris]